MKLYEYLKIISLRTKQFDKALLHYENYFSRFFDEKMMDTYAYLGEKGKQRERAIHTLRNIDLAKHYEMGSVEYKSVKLKLEALIEDLRIGL